MLESGATRSPVSLKDKARLYCRPNRADRMILDSQTEALPALATGAAGRSPTLPRDGTLRSLCRRVRRNEHTRSVLYAAFWLPVSCRNRPQSTQNLPESHAAVNLTDCSGSMVAGPSVPLSGTIAPNSQIIMVVSQH